DRIFGDPLLFVTRVEDRRSIARSRVITLTITCGRVVNLEEKLEKPAVADLGGFKDDLDCFGVGSMIAVGRIRNVTARIADARGNHAVIPAKQVLHAPEAATSQNGAFSGHWISSAWSR